MTTRKTERPAVKSRTRRSGAWRDAEQREELRERKRRLILQTAARAFSQYGYHKTSIDRIAAELQVTKPTIYYYVRNKEDILFQITQTALDDLDRAIAAEVQEGLSAMEQLERFFRVYGAIILSDLGVCMALISDRSLKSASRLRLRRLKKEFEIRVRRIVEHGRKDGSIRVRDPRMFAFAMFGAFNWMPQWFDPKGPLGTEAVATELIQLFRQAGAPDATPADAPRADRKAAGGSRQGSG